ncbi:MAG: HAMP domain-containing histidine kinase [Peptococcaceae bacterium]|nr:HAMP domain-containing histidine kinase [Peptococcaceae bacterium]
MWAKLRRKSDDYTQLQIKLYLRFVLIVISSFMVTLLLYKFLWYNQAGNLIVGVMMGLFGMDYEEARFFYIDTFRRNSDLIWFGTICLVSLLLFWLFFRWFVRFFNAINKGIDALLQENMQISLPQELMPIERKLHLVQQTLQNRERATREAEQRKNDMVMYLAHDIKTPLTSVIGYLSLLSEAPEMPAEQRAKYIGITLDKAQRLEQLIDEFFEITRYNFQQQQLTLETINLYYMLVQLTDEFYPLLQAHGNTIKLQAPTELTVYGDADKLARVFNNILKNAVAYSYPNTPICITAKIEEQNLEINFMNQGQTIRPQKLQSIFEKFFRLDSARASNTGGAGLGLAIAQEIVHLHGGEITASSADEITCFSVRLPVKNR